MLNEEMRHEIVRRRQGGASLRRIAKDPRQHEALLRERFAELGPNALRFFDGLLKAQRYGKAQACKVLALLGTYAHKDLLAAFERAVRFGAYSLNAVERILATQARPKSVLDTLAEHERRHLPEWLRDNPVSQRPTADYLHLVEESTHHGPPPQTDQAKTDDAETNQADADEPDGDKPRDDPAGPA